MFLSNNEISGVTGPKCTWLAVGSESGSFSHIKAKEKLQLYLMFSTLSNYDNAFWSTRLFSLRVCLFLVLTIAEKWITGNLLDLKLLFIIIFIFFAVFIFYMHSLYEIVFVYNLRRRKYLIFYSLVLNESSVHLSARINMQFLRTNLDFWLAWAYWLNTNTHTDLKDTQLIQKRYYSCFILLMFIIKREI